MTTIESRPPSPEDLADNAQQPCGHGRMMRKEDPRFIRGRGTYVDDVALPGMLHLAILRSPYAHARIVRIDVTAAQAHPKVKAVVTGADLAAKGLAWMPTLANDVQAVLATDKTRFQGQEVAFVVAEDRYSARDACELVDVDYEPRDPVVDARTALDPSAPVIRTDLEGKSDNHIFDWETGDAAAIADIAMRAHGAGDLPEGIEGGLDAEVCYNPSNLTYPYGAYFCVVDIDPGTAVVKVRRFLAVDDCGTRINPMIIEGQVHGGIVDGIGMALMEMIAFDEDGNCLGGSLMDYLIPTALEVPHLETGHTVTPSPHHPIGAKGIGESATVGSPPAVVNAVVDALAPFGVRHADMPLTPSRVWEAMQGRATPPI